MSTKGKPRSVAYRAVFLVAVMLAATATVGVVEGGPVPPTEWDQTYGGSEPDQAWSVIETDDGGFLLAGSTRSVGGGSTDAWLVKTDANGNEQWNQAYGGDGSEVARSVIETNDGGFVLVGRTNSYGVGSDAWLVKTDANGNEQWNRTYGGGGIEQAWSVIQTSDGGFAFGGDTSSFGGGSADLWVVKTDANGIEQWNRADGGSGFDRAYSVVETSDGGFAFGGLTRSFGDGTGNMRLVKTDANGNEQWNRTYGGSGFESARSMVETSDGGFALGGVTTSFGSVSGDTWLVKTDANGNEQWNRAYDSGGGDTAYSVVETSDGGVALGGYMFQDAGNADFWLVKTDTNGNEQWNWTYGGGDSDYAVSMVETSDGGFALAGRTASFGAGFDDFWLVKVGVPNSPPGITVDSASVTVLEGSTATNGGTFSDSDTGQDVSISTSVGFVTKTGTDAGTWQWSYDTTNGPDETQTVIVTADDGGGGVTTTTFDLTVDNVVPTIISTAVDDTANEGDPVSASGSFTDPGVLDTHSVTVDWGDSTVEAASVTQSAGSGTFTADHVYADSGTYTVTITVDDGDGGTATVAETVVVSAPPVAAFTVTPASPVMGDPVTFNASASTDPDGSIVSYEWDLDGDGSIDVMGAVVTHTYLSGGDRTVTLTVTDDTGATDEATQTVSVEARAFEDTNDNGVFDPGIDHLIPASAFADGKYDADNSALVIPAGVGPITADEIDFKGEGISIEVDLTATDGHMKIDAGSEAIDVSGVSIDAEKKVELKAEENVDVSGSTLTGKEVKIDSDGDIDATGSEMTAEKKVELKAKGSVDVSDSTLTGEKIKIDSDGDIDAVGSTITAEKKIELKAKGNVDISNATLTAKNVKIDADGTVTDAGTTITET